MVHSNLSVGKYTVTPTIKCYANILFFLRLDLLPAIDNGDNISQRFEL